jgi:nitrile hydratase beta subunit
VNGVHDMGGMQDMGPIHPEQNDLVFHASWERRVFALFNAVDFTWPVLRSELELIAPADYLRMSYYEKWLTALVPLLIKARMVTPAEIESGKPTGASTNKWHVVSVAEVATWIAPDSGTNGKPGVAAQFQATQRVRARNMNPLGHTRLPRYVRGKIGTIQRVRGVDVFPDAVAQGLGDKPQHVYTVRFTAQELWGAPASRTDSVYADLSEDYLEPA